MRLDYDTVDQMYNNCVRDMEKELSTIKEAYDGVEKPSHYMLMNGKLEVKDIIKDILGHHGFSEYCYGNIIKYVLRARKKENFEKDLRKAAQYISMVTE